jgi:hypothetical protein
MAAKKSIPFILVLLFNQLLKGQDFSPRWHYQIYEDKVEQGSYCGNAEKGIFAAIRNTSKLQIEGREWLSSSLEKVVLASLDSVGSIQWQKPVIAAGTIMPSVCPMVVDEKYLVAISSSNKGYWTIDGDTIYGSGVFILDKKGNVGLVQSMPGSIASNPLLSVKNKYLIKCNVLENDTINGDIYSAGFWVIEMDKAGKITRKVKLGNSLVNFSEFAVVANDTHIVFAGYASRNKPFLGNGWQIRALDSISRPGGNSSDLFVACLDTKGDLKWKYRIDSMSYGTSAYSMVLMSNGQILWTPTYFKSGKFLQKSIIVKFPGGGYPMFIAINMDGGMIVDFKVPALVAGGSNHGVKIFTDEKFRRCIIACRGGDSTGKALGITPNNWQTSFTGILYCDSNFKFTHKSAVPDFNFSIINTHNINYLIYPVYFPFGSLGTTLILDGVTYTNNLGNDVIVGNYTNEKFTRLNSNKLSNEQTLLLYPNPTYNEFSLIQNQDKWEYACVFNIQGEKCGIIKPLNGKWNVSTLPAGNYFLKFYNSNLSKIITAKLSIIQ